MKSDRNDRASVALVALRKAMKMTQQEFAVKVLQSAITTVSRYESGNPPPRGDVLLRFRDIASEQGQAPLAKIFQDVWLEDVDKGLGPGVRTFIMGGGGGLLVASLKKDKVAFAAAEIFLKLLDQLESEKLRQKVTVALATFRDTLRSFDPPGTHALNDAFLETFDRHGVTAIFTMAPEDTQTKSEARKKRARGKATTR
jgi:transcriptional regulator with XRE-family HTH domain